MPVMNDTDQMLINEARKLERAIKKRQDQLEILAKSVASKKTNLTLLRPKRYSVEFNFDPNAGPGGARIQASIASMGVQEQTFVVDGGTVFHCASIESSLRIVGQLRVSGGVSGNSANLTLPWVGPLINRQAIFDYFWRIRDTGSDREWQNIEQPSVFMLGGHLGPCYLPIRARIAGGSEVSVEIEPAIRPTTLSLAFGAVNNVILHVSFHGHEVAV